MFWGDEYASDINVVGVRRHARMENLTNSDIDINNDNNKQKVTKVIAKKDSLQCGDSIPFIDDTSKFHFSIKGGIALQSRCGNIRVKVKGKGKTKTLFITNNFYTSLFSGGWVNFYASMDHDGLRFYKNRLNINEIFTILSIDFKSLKSEKLFKEIAIQKNNDGKSEVYLQDTHVIIIKLLDNDEILLRFPTKKMRVQWYERLNVIIDIQISERRRKNISNNDNHFFKRFARAMTFRKK